MEHLKQISVTYHFAGAVHQLLNKMSKWEEAVTEVNASVVKHIHRKAHHQVKEPELQPNNFIKAITRIKKGIPL